MVVLLAAAAYDAAVALEWISTGSQPGADAPGQGVVTVAAFLALLTGIVATLLSRRILRRWLWRNRGRAGARPLICLG
ncbi:MAG: hypothetical protein ACXVRI_03535 [Gaiellaceae bacterium]